MTSPVSEFARIADAWLSGFKAKFQLGLALKTQRRWQLHHALTIFTHEIPPNFVPIYVSTASVVAFRSFTPLSPAEINAELKSLLDPGAVAKTGWLLGNELATVGVAPLRPILHRVRPPRMGAGPERFPMLVLLGEKTPPDASIEELDMELQRHHEPYDGLADLIAELRIPLDVNQISDPSIWATAEYVVTPPVKLDPPWAIKSEKGTFNLSATPTLESKKLSIGLKLFHASSAPRRTQINVEDIVWRSETDLLVGTHEFAAPETPLARAFVNYADEICGIWWYRDETLSFNPVLQLHRAVDGSEVFRKTFFDVKNDFEDRVTLLLNLLQLSTLKYGEIASLTDAPDIMAYSADGRYLFVVECTIGDINNRGKLFRLRDRVKSIAEKVASTNRSVVAIQGVIFSPLPRSETAAYWAMAQNLQISLVCREQIASLLDRLESVPSSDELYQATLSNIPSIAPAATPATPSGVF